MKILGYTYNADHHCIDCTRKKFTSPQNLGIILDSCGVPLTATDDEGNKIHPVFSTAEILETIACGDCRAVIYEVARPAETDETQLEKDYNSQRARIKAESAGKHWCSKVSNQGSPHEQGLIIDEVTGRNVAVTYDPKDAPLIAAAPDLLAALEAVNDEYGEGGMLDGTKLEKQILAAIARAREN